LETIRLERIIRSLQCDFNASGRKMDARTTLLAARWMPERPFDEVLSRTRRKSEGKRAACVAAAVSIRAFSIFVSRLKRRSADAAFESGCGGGNDLPKIK
jgi:hypothetical protein